MSRKEKKDPRTCRKTRTLGRKNARLIKEVSLGKKKVRKKKDFVKDGCVHAACIFVKGWLYRHPQKLKVEKKILKENEEDDNVLVHTHIERNAQPSRFFFLSGLC